MQRAHFPPLVSSGLIETGYVVRHLESAIAEWRALFNVKSFEIHQSDRPIVACYHGDLVAMRLRVGLAKVGVLVVELIEVLDETPSVYAETISRRGYGFHHWGVLEPHYDDVLRQYAALGHQCVQTMEMPDYGRVAYVDTCDALGGMIELFEDTPAMRTLFQRLGTS